MKGAAAVAGKPRWVCCREVTKTEPQSSAGFRFLPVGTCRRGVRPGSQSLSLLAFPRQCDPTETVIMG